MPVGHQFEGPSFPSQDLSALANYQEIHNYLNVGDADEIARIASNLAPKSITFDESKLVDMAIAIQEKVAQKLKSKRYQILDSMSSQTLDTLGKMLEISTTSLKSDPMVFFDSIKGPAFYKLHSLGKLGKEVSLPRTTNDNSLMDTVSMMADSLLGSFDERTAVKRPQFPCDAEVLLRYFSNEPDIPLDTLHAAFKGFIRVSTPYKSDEEIREMQRQESGFRDRMIASPQIHSESEQGDYIRYLIEASETSIRSLQEALDYRASFTPTKKCPEDIESEASSDYENYLSQDNQMNQTLLLLRLNRCNFQSFWRKYGATYKQIESDKKAAKQKTSKRNSSAGKMGSNAAGSKIWEKHNQELVSYCEGMEIPTQGDNFTKFIKDFAASRSANVKTQAKIRSYFGTLWTFVDQKTAPDLFGEIARLLVKDKIKNTSSSTIEKSLTALREIKAQSRIQ